jgi:cobalt/nickel transport protein
MKHFSIILLGTFLLLINAQFSVAHFGMVIPAEPVVTAENRIIELTLSFSHPFEETGMHLSKPSQFYVIKGDTKTDLLHSLRKTTIMDHQGWQTQFEVKRPGVYHFVMEPAPYWEATEDLSIIHYTKVIVPAFGSEDGWDLPVGLTTEIVPLLRPFGNYAGNTFVGQVLVNGEAIGGAEVEVELYNYKQNLKAPSDYHITQRIKTDSNGIFTFSCPQPGWWGFAALSHADFKLKNPQGEDKGVELGAVLWIYMDSYPK